MAGQLFDIPSEQSRVLVDAAFSWKRPNEKMPREVEFHRASRLRRYSARWRDDTRARDNIAPSGDTQHQLDKSEEEIFVG